MNDAVNTVTKVVVLAGGAVVGAILARKVDTMLASRAFERSDFDKTRYEQGLTAKPSEPPTENRSM